MIRLTASALDRVEVCPGSVTLPRRPHVGRDTETGRQIHLFLDRVVAVGREVALGEIGDVDLAARCAGIDLDAIPVGSESEVAFAYDPESDRAERLTLGAYRAYPDDTRIFGTADRVGFIPPATAYVADFKTGTAKMRARDALQLRFLALAAARHAGLDEAHVAMLYLRHDGRWFTDRAAFDSLDLEETRGQILQIRARAQEAERTVAAGGFPMLVPGIHCEHCPAAPGCPAQERQQQALVARDVDSIGDWFAGLDEAEAGRIAEQAIVVAKLAAVVREAANERAASMPDGLPLQSGRTLRRVRYGAQVIAPEGKDRIAAIKAELREQGLIRTEQTWQMRIVGTARKVR